MSRPTMWIMVWFDAGIKSKSFEDAEGASQRAPSARPRGDHAPAAAHAQDRVTASALAHRRVLHPVHVKRSCVLTHCCCNQLLQNMLLELSALVLENSPVSKLKC
ncbi:hypothetical protein OESDEN_13398 [Oesophagostomum dentatum]|uniref:Uncharacterized protein n=1 Tax=Oesophagostomum dentatum TaxID=61180 RepID=A0A0B1SNC1_OESDE|nr:hypothetical protein OESDEN_13398 [Oesophagostomum dentatum]